MLRHTHTHTHWYDSHSCYLTLIQSHSHTHLALLEFDTSEIGQFDVSILVQQDVAALDVAVDDVPLVEVEQSLQQLASELLGPQLSEFPLPLDDI